MPLLHYATFTVALLLKCASSQTSLSTYELSRTIVNHGDIAMFSIIHQKLRNAQCLELAAVGGSVTEGRYLRAPFHITGAWQYHVADLLNVDYPCFWANGSGTHNLRVIAQGGSPSDPWTEILSGQQEQLLRKFDLVMVDEAINDLISPDKVLHDTVSSARPGQSIAVRGGSGGGGSATRWVKETYNYYYLPFCKKNPTMKAQHSWGGLGEVLQGNELINSQLDIKFKEPSKGMGICSMTLDERKANTFEDAIRRQYWFELFMDDLPVWGFVGELKKGDAGVEQAYIYTSKTFDISYNKERVNCGMGTQGIEKAGARWRVSSVQEAMPLPPASSSLPTLDGSGHPAAAPAAFGRPGRGALPVEEQRFSRPLSTLQLSQFPPQASVSVHTQQYTYGHDDVQTHGQWDRHQQHPAPSASWCRVPVADWQAAGAGQLPATAESLTLRLLQGVVQQQPQRPLSQAPTDPREHQQQRSAWLAVQQQQQRTHQESVQQLFCTSRDPRQQW